MAEDQTGPPGSSGQRPTEPLGSPAPPQRRPSRWPGSPRGPGGGLVRRLAAAFLDWILVGILAAAIGELFGVQVPSVASVNGDVLLPACDRPLHSGRAGLLHLLPRHHGRPVDRNKILGIRVLDAGTGRSLPYPRA